MPIFCQLLYPFVLALDAVRDGRRRLSRLIPPFLLEMDGLGVRYHREEGRYSTATTKTEIYPHRAAEDCQLHHVGPRLSEMRINCFISMLGPNYV